MPIVMRRLRAGATLYHEGAETESIYFVRAGTFKSYRTAEDGYEQVLGFTSRAEVLGFDAICIGHHPTAAVALEESSVYVVPVQDVFTLGQRIPALDRVLHLAVSSQLTRHEELADLMAPVAAEVRLARFLMQHSHHMAACGQSPRRFHLRMSRRDIARYLGVAHETVSRSFSALSGWGCVRVDNREVEIVDLDRLKTFARSTRRQNDEPLPTNGTRLNFVRPRTGERVPCGVAGS
jgi:CRP/FNR family transcriptional regulator